MAADPVRIAFLKTSPVHSCFFRETFESCTKNERLPAGFLLQISVFISKILFPHREIQFLAAEGGYDLTNNTEQNSLLDLINTGKADLSPPHMIISAERKEKLPHYGPIMASTRIFLYKNSFFGHEITPQMSLLDFYNWKTVLLLLFSGLFLKISAKSLEKSQLGKLVSQHFSLAFSLSLTFFLSYLSSTVTLLYNRPATREKPFKNAAEIIAALKSGAAQAAVRPASMAMQKYEILAQNFGPFKLPPIPVYSNTETIELMKAKGHQIVFYTATTDVIFIKNRKCGFETVEDSFTSTQFSTVYHKQGLNHGAINGILRNVIRVEYRHLENHIQPPLLCYIGANSEILKKRLIPSSLKSGKSFRLSNNTGSWQEFRYSYSDSSCYS